MTTTESPAVAHDVATSVLPTLPPLAPEAFRLTRLQVFNWGTFSGVHEVAVAPVGFLFIGQSGSGKSSILDAHSALFIPPKWVDFNAAGRAGAGQSRDRSMVSYLRGMWSSRTAADGNEVRPEYLRTETTWSALAATYTNAAGQAVTIARLMWLRGKSTVAGDVKNQFMVFERAFDLSELQFFPRADFDVRKLKSSLPEAFVSDQFTNYQERFMRLLGIPSELALRLLQKTQGAKNLDNLNALLRDYMLDVPKTFKVAEVLVNEFTELNEAHRAVVTAREQIALLQPAEIEQQVSATAQLKRNSLRDLQVGLLHYQGMREIGLLDEAIRRHGTSKDAASSALLGADETARQEQTRLREMEDRHRNAGGSQIEAWESEIAAQNVVRGERVAKFEAVRSACGIMDWAVPTDVNAHAALGEQARLELEGWEASQQEQEALRDRLRDERRVADEGFRAAVVEVKALEAQRSNLPAHAMRLRDTMASALGLEAKDLPYAAELLEVRAEEGSWQGAIERALRGFALSILVHPRHLVRVAQYVNDHQLGGLVRYRRVDRVERRPVQPLGTDSLVLKVAVAPGPFMEWLEHELRERHDYDCVDSPMALTNTPKGLTREGQVKRASDSFEKDDRHAVGDQSRWILGFDNRAKLALFQQRAQELAGVISAKDLALAGVSEDTKLRGRRVLQCQSIVNTRWSDIDVAATVRRIAALEQDIAAARQGNKDLAELAVQIGAQRVVVEKAQTAAVRLRTEVEGLQSQINGLQRQLGTRRADPGLIPPSPGQVEGLDPRFERHAPVLLENLGTIGTRVNQELGREIEALSEEISDLRHATEEKFKEFVRRWPSDSAGLDATIAAAPDFFAKLERLRVDGLPAHEERFKRLLQEQTGQNLTALSHHIREQHQEIRERLDMVNTAMRSARFNAGTVLSIDMQDRALSEVRQFAQDIRNALAFSLEEDPRNAEARFEALAAIVRRLASADTADQRWRELVLDVRQHVEFVAREKDLRGVEVEVYASGAGKSGGQREKLAVTCLAAALRYQLSGESGDAMVYTTVLIDEAFGRTDQDYTAAIVEVFRNFGFQPVMATPMRSVMTLEPYIGGACHVRIENRKQSAAAVLTLQQLEEVVRRDGSAELTDSVA